MEISEVKADELEDVLDLQYLAYRSEAELYNDFTIPPLIQTLDELNRECCSGICLVAKRNEKIVGSVRAELSGGVCKIGKLIVHRNSQNQGVGTALMQRIESLFPNASECEVFTGCKSLANIRLDKRLGY